MGAAVRASILISSAGRRVELLTCFRRAAAARGIDLAVVAVDLDPATSAACAVADRAFAVPRCTAEGYADRVLEIAVREGVSLVVPTIDPELRPLACAANRFAEQGVRVHVSPPEVVDIVRDKCLTADHLGRAGLPVPATVPLETLRADAGRLPWPVFLKPARGSASRGLMTVAAPEDLPRDPGEPMVAQALLEGPEYTVNMFVDARGVLRSVVPHRRLNVRAGEVEKGVTVRRAAFHRLAEGIAAALPAARGVLCFQLIDDARTGPAIIEINARFGGGYPLADKAGATFAEWLLAEACGLPAPYHDDWREGVLMLRYDAAVFREGVAV